MSEIKVPPLSSFKPEEMVEVSREEFISGSIVPCDVYVQLSSEKYVLLARSGTKAIFTELHLAERKDVTIFHVHKDDYKSCVGQNLTVAGIVLDKESLSDEVKTNVLGRTCDTVFKEITILGFKPESMKHSQMVAQNIQKLVANKSDLNAIINLMSGISNDLIRHSMAVSAISVMIANGLGWKFPQTLQRLALGSLLHDVGMKEIPEALIHKPRHLMTRDEVAIYETHVTRGVEVLRSMPTVPDEIIAMVNEHHENAIGEGYPRKIREFNMNPLAKVVSLADAFADLTIQNANNPNPRSAADALFFIESVLGQPYSKMAFQGLQKALDENVLKKASAAAAVNAATTGPKRTAA